MDKGQPMDDAAKEALKGEVTAAVEQCLAKPYSSKDDAIDAVIADLEALKTGPGMGGLGSGEGMELDENAVVDEEEQ